MKALMFSRCVSDIVLPVHGSAFPSFINTGYLMVMYFQWWKQVLLVTNFYFSFPSSGNICIHTSINKRTFP